MMNICNRFDLGLSLDREGNSWERFAADPWPSWCNTGPTIFKASRVAPGQIPAGADIAFCSIPFDGTASTHIGARNGAAAIREATYHYFSMISGPPGRMTLKNLRNDTDVVVSCSRSIVDFGDLHVYPTDPVKQLYAIIAETKHVAHSAPLTVILGGEHTISYPSFVGVSASFDETFEKKLGYVQIDHHFDFGQTSPIHGPFYHGSNARRISELPWMAAGRIGFVGQGDLTGLSQIDSLRSSGHPIATRSDIRARGYLASLRDVLDAVAQVCDGIYLSIDIDVCDCSVAPGTGNVTIGGLTSEEFISTADLLSRYPIRAIDLVEVNPGLDPSRRTPALAARLLFEALFLEPLSPPTLNSRDPS